MARWWTRLTAAWMIWPLAGALAPLSSHAEESIIAGHIVNVAGRVRIRKDGSKDTKDIRFARAGDVVLVGDIINTPSDGMIKLLLKDRSLMDLGPSSLFKVNAFKSLGNNERQVDSTIMYGNLRAAVTQKIEGRGHFKVRSPSATMGVRGTEFLVRSSMPNDLKSMASFLNGGALQTSNANGPAGLDSMIKSEVTVLQGKVEVALPQALQTPQGPSATGAGMPSAISNTASGTLMLQAGAQITAQAGGQAPQPPATRVLDATALTQVASGARVADNTFTASLEIKAATKEGEQAQAREQPREQRQQVAQNESTAETPPARQESRPADAPAEVTSRNETVADRGPAAQGSGPNSGPPPAAAPAAVGNLGMASFVQAAMAGVQMGGAMTQTIRPVDFVPAVPLSATGIQAQGIPNPNQLHNLVIQIRLQ